MPVKIDDSICSCPELQSQHPLQGIPGGASTAITNKKTSLGISLKGTWITHSIHSDGVSSNQVGNLTKQLLWILFYFIFSGHKASVKSRPQSSFIQSIKCFRFITTLKSEQKTVKDRGHKAKTMSWETLKISFLECWEAPSQTGTRTMTSSSCGEGPGGQKGPEKVKGWKEEKDNLSVLRQWVPRWPCTPQWLRALWQPGLLSTCFSTEPLNKRLPAGN